MDFIRGFLPGGVSRRLDRYLAGVEFPLNKGQLISKLRENKVPGLVVSQLDKRLPAGEYSSAAEVLTALKQR
ncbi:MAG: DUF2795 domain-containing protein [Rubrobacteraceae bacterium]